MFGGSRRGRIGGARPRPMKHTGGSEWGGRWKRFGVAWFREEGARLNPITVAAVDSGRRLKSGCPDDGGVRRSLREAPVADRAVRVRSRWERGKLCRPLNRDPVEEETGQQRWFVEWDRALGAERRGRRWRSGDQRRAVGEEDGIQREIPYISKTFL